MTHTQFMTLFIFKLVYTDIYHSYNIPSNWTVNYAFLRIRDYIVDDFGINNTFEFIHIDKIPQYYNNRAEEYISMSSTLFGSTDTIRDHFYKKIPNSFYIRQIECDNFEAINGTIERT
jgi:hypothetical protein